ncbi:MAG: hypothetical protein PW999_24285 [Paraburkholderia tropica]|nr:hypothetical protein [Paraburkholderia tropica]
MLDAARLLDARYTLVVTNVPYLVRGKQNDTLKNYCASVFSDAKNDLATVFIERCYELTNEGGTVAIVSPQNWWFLQTYSSFRAWLLRNCEINALAALGEEAWEYFGERGPLATLMLASRNAPREESSFLGINVVAQKSLDDKKRRLESGAVERLPQSSQLNNPDFRLTLELGEGGELLEKYAYSYEGLTTGDLDRFVFQFWDVGWRSPFSPFVQNAVETEYYTGRSDVIRWGRDGELVSQFPGAYIKGKAAWENRGLRITQMRVLSVTIYEGEIFGKSAATLVPYDKKNLPALWCFCTSEDYTKAVRRIDQKVNVTVATLAKVPFDLARWQRVAAERYPNGMPKPYSDDPTQWLFHGHPQPATDPLQVAVARLAGYRWPAETDATMELADEARTWIVRCEKLAEHVDDDGIVCLPSVRGEPAAHERVLKLLIAAWETVQPGSWKPAVLDKLLADADYVGKGLDVWLRDKFFEQHTKRFQHRPFIWHVWDGLKDGFAALVNCHQLDGKNLERLIHTYLGDWIRQQEAGVRDGIDGAQPRLAAAQDLKRRLELILEGEAPYDIFVRWKSLSEQPIGWNPDLNDGVRLNIRPFMTAEVLRHNKKPKLNISWDKDRGKDVESAPWYERFKGERINDCHLTVAEKKEARKAQHTGVEEQQGQS